MSSFGSSRRAGSVGSLAAVLLLGATTPAFASHADDRGPAVAATWETSADGGQRTDEVARFSVTSPTANNGVESVYVAGVARKSPALEAAGMRDLDVLTTAFDASTGAVKWNVRHDDDLGSNDRPVGLEIGRDNNLLHVVADADGDAVTLTYAARNGDLSRSFRTPAFSVKDTAITVAGSWLFQAGTSGGDFRVLGHEVGPQTTSLDERPVKGTASSVDAHNDDDNGDTASWRTFVATGQETVFGSGGDVYTVAYRTDTEAKLWERRWASPDNRLDAGVATEMTFVRSLGHGVVFVTGKTFHPSRGFDLWVTALDARTGSTLWTGPDGMRFHGGDALGDDVPVALEYHDATGVLYVVGTSERGTPHGEDIVVLAFDGRTGDQLAIGHASGDISNGDDTPTDLAVNADGTQVFVSGKFHNRLDTGGYRAGVFGFAGRTLTPIGLGALTAGGPTGDQAAGVDTSLDGSRVLVGGSSDPSNLGLDHTAAAYSVAAFVAAPDPVVPEFPPAVAVLALLGIGALLGLRGRRANTS